jgi:ABC-type sugar transport system ATPase subunit
VSVERGSSAATADEALSVSGLSGKGFRDVSFSVRKGEVLGLFGLVGAGRTEVARALFGIDPAESGELRAEGVPLRIRSPQDAVAAGIGLVPEDRKLQGLVLSMRIAPNVSLASLERLSTGGLISAGKERAMVDGFIEKLRIRCSGADQPVRELSGGNQQKVVLAKWLDTRPRVLILDEPTKGVDVAAKAEIQTIVRQLAGSGTAVILISSELEEVRQMADRILVFRAGRVSGEVTGEGAADAQLMGLAT